MLAGFNSLCRADVCSLTAGEVSLFSPNGACFLSTVAQRSGEHDRRLATMADVSVACLSLSLSVCLFVSLSVVSPALLCHGERNTLWNVYILKTQIKSRICVWRIQCSSCTVCRKTSIRNLSSLQDLKRYLYKQLQRCVYMMWHAGEVVVLVHNVWCWVIVKEKILFVLLPQCWRSSCYCSDRQRWCPSYQR